MYLSEIEISNYRLFNENKKISFEKGLTVIVGENASGKSSIIDAIRLLLFEDEYGHYGIQSSDFYRNYESGLTSNEIKVIGRFSDLSEDESIAFLPWLDANDSTNAILNLHYENKETPRGKFKRRIWGGESQVGIFEWELIYAINCVYLPPLRDAEEKLRAFRGSRLARLLKILKVEPIEGEHELVKRYRNFNKTLLKEDTIAKANTYIKTNLKKSVGSVFGQDSEIQFAEATFDKIVERLRLLFHPTIITNSTDEQIERFRDLNENSLGYNNIIYLATVLAEFENVKISDTLHKMLLIEEPEAHLHPQLQIRLLKYLQQRANEENIQIIITTHSPTIAASVDINSIKVMTLNNKFSVPIFTSLANCYLSSLSKYFLERWMDITKSTLLFAKAVILVEGIAEALVVPELAKRVIKNIEGLSDDTLKTLDDFGVSIINMNGKYFKHFMQLFAAFDIENSGNGDFIDSIPKRCSGITDCDPSPVAETKPTIANPCDCNNSYAKDDFIKMIRDKSKNCRVFKNLKTFEYDLALEGNNLSLMSEIYLSMYKKPPPEQLEKLNNYIENDWIKETDEKKAEAALWLLKEISDKKGLFAQCLSYKLQKDKIEFAVPYYIKEAIKWTIWKDE